MRNAASYRNKFIESYKKLTTFANFRRTILLRAERKLCKQPNGPTIIAISQYVAEQFKRHYAVADERIVVIPNGIKIHTRVDTDKTNRLRSQILAQLGQRTRDEGRGIPAFAGTGLPLREQGDEPVFFLFVANNFRLKGLAVLIKAMQLAASRGTSRPGFLIVVGNNREHKYRRLANKLNIHKKITFLGSIRYIQDVLSISDVAVLPTFYDPCSRYILEALAADKPVITTSFNGATDLFVNNRHGKVIDSPEDVPALAEAISYFTKTDNIQKASQAIATDNLKDKISISRVAKQLIDVYESILQRKGQK